tara:strand:+ start:633 stop:914 length:282 start_codon:yes stop_codon:yes gene_type:complete
MSMPKGKKFENGYCSISSIPDAKNYKQISVACGKRGIKIGPSNARNVLLTAMRKIAKPICEDNNKISSEDEIMAIAKNPDFQLSVAELIKEMP